MSSNYMYIFLEQFIYIFLVVTDVLYMFFKHTFFTSEPFLIFHLFCV